MRVAVLKGGRSFEREVSLHSGANVEAALTRLGHDVLPIDVDSALVRTLKAERPDVAFIALHGIGGEDGTVQELLEILEIPYTGSGVLACRRSMDKVVAKSFFVAADIPTPEFIAFSQGAFRELGAADALAEVEERLGLPIVVKPAKQGSALGISIVRDPARLPPALMTALSFDDRVLLEQFVPGRELAISILGEKTPVTLPPVEPVPIDRDFYDFEARYTPGLTELRVPADLPPETTEEAERLALGCFTTIGCRGLGRVDMILDGDDRLWVLELNAIPGMTDTSLLPAAAEAAGMGFDDVVARVLAEAALGP